MASYTVERLGNGHRTVTISLDGQEDGSWQEG